MVAYQPDGLPVGETPDSQEEKRAKLVTLSEGGERTIETLQLEQQTYVTQRMDLNSGG